MLNIFNYLKRPEYVFRPKQVLRRLQRLGKQPQSVETVDLPWGAPVRAELAENVGASIIYWGIFDKIVPETIWRLLEPGENAADIGANIGQNTSAMAFKSGPKGRVFSFEPHPEIFAELKSNWNLWPEKIKQPVQLENVALGEAAGAAWLMDGSDFGHNRGSASLVGREDDSGSSRKHRVIVRQLDEFLPPGVKVGICKIDVEGHELAVLKGSKRTLERRAIRDIVFEDFHPKPSAVTDFLKQYGFTVFELHEGWYKPRLDPMTENIAAQIPGFSFNYLATLDPERAVNKFRTGGWHCLTC